MGTNDTQSSRLPPPYPLEETPLGIVVLAFLGIFSGLFGFFSWFATFGAAHVSTTVTVGMMLLASAQVIAMLGLLRLSELAWYTTFAVYTVSVFVHLSQSNYAGIAFSLAVMLYVRYKKPLFTS